MWENIKSHIIDWSLNEVMKDGLKKVGDSVGDGVAKGVAITAVGIGKFLLQFEGVFIIVAIAGVYLIIFGNKEWGTKLTSGSLLFYFLAEVLSKC